MATLQLTELLVDATVAKLRNGLAARVAAINAEKGPPSGHTDIAIDAPGADDIIAFGSDTIHRYPTIVVTQGRDGIDFSDGEGPHSLGISDQILVGVMEADQQRQRLGYKLLRQVRAVTEVLWDDEPGEALAHPFEGGFAAYHIRLESMRPGPVYGHDTETSMWKDTYEIVFRAERVEEGL
jgi:hypothetical protein